MASEVLRQLYEADQDDRTQQRIDWSVVSERDRARRAEIWHLLDTDELQDGWDHYWAAVVLIHGTKATDIECAFELARRAMELEPQSLQIRSFYALAKDRLLLNRGELQWYGTQKVIVNGEVALAPIDPDAVTDEERRAMGVPTLSERNREIDLIKRARAEQRRRQGGQVLFNPKLR
jgi:hypothetical protein